MRLIDLTCDELRMRNSRRMMRLFPDLYEVLGRPRCNNSFRMLQQHTHATCDIQHIYTYN